jgi:hypothetical protein
MYKQMYTHKMYTQKGLAAQLAVRLPFIHV